MSVNAKLVAFCGLMLALTEICIALGSIIETNTLFLLAAASYIVGIVIREMGQKIGAAFYFAGVLLGVFIAPNKFYVLSYGAMGLCILFRELSWDWIGRLDEKYNKNVVFWIVKFLVFNTIYVGILFIGWELLFTGSANWEIIAIAIIGGQIGFLIYDWAYNYVQREIWTKIRGGLV